MRFRRLVNRDIEVSTPVDPPAEFLPGKTLTGAWLTPAGSRRAEMAVLEVGADRCRTRTRGVDGDDLRDLGDHLFALDQSLDPSQLRRAGIGIHRLTSQAIWATAATTQDHADIRRLRRVAYRAVGKVSHEVRDEDMSDAYDADAVIITGRLRGRLVASARVILPTAAALTEVESRAHLPVGLGLGVRGDLAEASRLCVAPSLWGSDFFEGLISRCYEIAVRANRRYLVASAAGPLVEAYCRIGARRLGVSHAMFDDVAHEVIAWDLAGLHDEERLACDDSFAAAYQRIIVPALQRLRAS